MIRSYNRKPLLVQLLIPVTLVIAVIIGALMSTNYRTMRQTIVDDYVNSSGSILELELQNFEQYMHELAMYSLQPRYDSSLCRIMESRAETISSADQDYLLDQMKFYFYSRSDINSYEMYLTGPEMSYGRYHSSQHFRRLSDTGITKETGYTECSKNKYYNAIMPSAEEPDMLLYYQAIIRIETGKPYAVIKLGVSNQYGKSLIKNHKRKEERVFILNKNNEILLSDLAVKQANQDEISMLAERLYEDGSAVELDGALYYLVKRSADKYGLKIISLLPASGIQNRLSELLRTIILYGIIAWIVTAILMFVFIRILTKPLTALSRHMETVGKGEFHPVSMNRGSKEVAELTDSFNDMLEHIETLIEKNYVAEINEKTSRLAALEAQVNPHYLYNTLQAIGTEALICGQPQINRMLTSLASNLRYTIKDGDLVPISQELKYVNNYVLLQKMRLEDRLTVTIDQEEFPEDPVIPKISIQTLIENAIIHGMGNGTADIHIRVKLAKNDGMLEILVEDDGCGISEEQLSQMREEFSQYRETTNVGKIGLLNLYSRLHILFQGRALMEIESEVNHGTRIRLLIPIEM